MRSVTVTTRRGQRITVTYARPVADILQNWATYMDRQRYSTPVKPTKRKTKSVPVGG